MGTNSDKRQRIQKKELIGENLEAEDLPLEHTQRKDNKNVNQANSLRLCLRPEKESHTSRIFQSKKLFITLKIICRDF